jgi:hypothetical protein
LDRSDRLLRPAGGIGITVAAAHEKSPGRKPKGNRLGSAAIRRPVRFQALPVRSYRYFPLVTAIFVTCLIVSNIIAVKLAFFGTLPVLGSLFCRSR